jgi:cyclic beta-1,2-glucan synthetase
VQSRLTALLDEGPWRMWKHQSGGAFLLRSDTMGQAERALFMAVAQAVLETDRGDLRAHLARPPQTPWRRCRCRRSRIPKALHPPAQPSMSVGRAGADADQRHRRIRRSRPHLRDRLDGDQETPAPWVNVIANPAVRHDPERERIRDDVVGEQPREPADAVCERSR